MSRVYLSWTPGSGDEQRVYREAAPDGTEQEPAFPSGYDLIDTLGTDKGEYLDTSAPDADVVYYAFTAVEDGTESTPVVDAAGSVLADSDDGGTTTDEIALSEEWTPRWQSAYEDWTLTTSTEYEGDSALAFEHVGNDGAPFALSWDNVGTPADVEILDQFRVPSATGSHARAYLRCSGDTGAENGYWVDFDDGENAFRLGKYTDGTPSTLQTFGAPAENTFFYRRFRAEGDSLKVRVWPATQNEPVDWDVEVTDSDASDGWVGLGSFEPDLVETTVLSVATGGETAKSIGFDSRPSISWVAPTDGEAVNETVTGQIAASDPEDADDSLLVEYSIDGGTWSEALYNSETGAYEFIWDTTTVSDGNHTLEAEVTDSSGNINTASITVTADNSGQLPTVEGVSVSEVATESQDAEFDVDWQVSDSDGDLDTVDLLLVGGDGSTKDDVTIPVDGETAGDTSRLVASGEGGSGNSYTIELTVTDTEGNAVSETETTTASGDTGSTPVINRLSVSEAGRPDPHAEVTAVWDVSDADGDLANVDVVVSNTGDTVQQVNWSLFGSSASDTDSFKIKDGDGQSFEITLTVSDQTGDAVSETVSVDA